MDETAKNLTRMTESARKLASAHKYRYSDDPAVREAYLRRRREWDRQLRERVRADPERLERKRAYHREFYHRNKLRKAQEPSEGESPNDRSQSAQTAI